jgi:hypothetical protein
MKASFSVRLGFLLALVVAVPAQALVINFENLPAGKIVQDTDLPPGYQLIVVNKNKSHPSVGVIFDSACPPTFTGASCSGEDPDLLTPGAGNGNTKAQGKVLIVPEDIVDKNPCDGLVDDPDDELCGGKFKFIFPCPSKLKSIRLIDIDTHEGETHVLLFLSAGGTQKIMAVPLGNNSAQTIEIPEPIPFIDGFLVDCQGSCAIDDIKIEECAEPTTTSTTTSTTTTTLEPRCGDGNLDSGEACDEGEDNSNEPDAECREDCTPRRCGDGIHDTGEECDNGAGNTDAPGTTCRTDCTLPNCGDGIVDSGEDCDEGANNSNEPDATCREDCSARRCGDGILDEGEICDEGNANSNLPNAPCRPDCTLPFCGDGVTDSNAGEECDNGTANSDTTPNACRTDCKLPFCGDGVVDPLRGEQCEPAKPNAENCANQIDDDGDGLVDCADPDCPVNVQVCGFDCRLAACQDIKKDPAVIRFNGRGGPDMFWIHGHFLADPDIDFTRDRFAVMLSNEKGMIYQGMLVPGEMRRKIGGKGRYVFRDSEARAGRGAADGIGRVGMRLRAHGVEMYVYFRLRAYGDFSAADVPVMTTQIAAGDHTGTLTAEWKKKSYGWVLKQRYFGDLTSK